MSAKKKKESKVDLDFSYHMLPDVLEGVRLLDAEILVEDPPGSFKFYAVGEEKDADDIDGQSDYI